MLLYRIRWTPLRTFRIRSKRQHSSRGQNIRRLMPFLLASALPLSATATPITFLEVKVPYSINIPISSQYGFPGVTDVIDGFKSAFSFEIDTFNDSPSDNLIQIRSIEVVPSSSLSLSGSAGIAIPGSTVQFPRSPTTKDLDLEIWTGVTALGGRAFGRQGDGQVLLDYRSLPPQQVEPLTPNFVRFFPSSAYSIRSKGEYLTQQIGQIAAVLDTELRVNFDSDSRYTLTSLDGSAIATGNLTLRYDIETLRFTKSSEERASLLARAEALQDLADKLALASIAVDIYDLGKKTEGLTSGDDLTEQLKNLDSWLGLKAKINLNIVSAANKDAVPTVVDTAKTILEYRDNISTLGEVLARRGTGVGMASDLITIAQAVSVAGAAVNLMIANDPPNSDYSNPSSVQNDLKSLLTEIQDATETARESGLPVEGIKDLGAFVLTHLEALDAYERYLGALQAGDKVAALDRIKEARGALSDSPRSLSDLAPTLDALVSRVVDDLDSIGQVDAAALERTIQAISEIALADPDLRTELLPLLDFNEAEFARQIDVSLTMIQSSYGFAGLPADTYSLFSDFSRLSLGFANTSGEPGPGPGPDPSPVPAPSPLIGLLTGIVFLSRFRSKESRKSNRQRPASDHANPFALGPSRAC